MFLTEGKPDPTEACRILWHGLLEEFTEDEGMREGAFRDVVRRYSELARHYHNLDHICMVVKWTWLPEDNPPALEFAAILHDVIYDPRAADNEERSAEYAQEVLKSLGVPREVCEETARLILLTKTHEVAENDAAGAALVDADLVVLGSYRAAYDAYAAAIRKEYAWVPEPDYRAGRSRVLERFLTRTHIYHGAEFRERFEAPARANLARELASLQGSR
jgi:predicted metal-dependent HD superfamily phosphohydrolase